MGEFNAPVDPLDTEVTLTRIRTQAAAGRFRVTQHARQEMADEDITLDDVLDVIAQSQILENYPEHQRGACCLLDGVTTANRPLHVVCTSAQPALIIITVYEPKPPKWPTPDRRRRD